jgi:hypothetical protein
MAGCAPPVTGNWSLVTQFWSRSSGHAVLVTQFLVTQLPR